MSEGTHPLCLIEIEFTFKIILFWCKEFLRVSSPWNLVRLPSSLYSLSFYIDYRGQAWQAGHHRQILTVGEAQGIVKRLFKRYYINIAYIFHRKEMENIKRKKSSHPWSYHPYFTFRLDLTLSCIPSICSDKKQTGCTSSGFFLLLLFSGFEACLFLHAFVLQLLALGRVVC